MIHTYIYIHTNIHIRTGAAAMYGSRIYVLRNLISDAAGASVGIPFSERSILRDDSNFSEDFASDFSTVL